MIKGEKAKERKSGGKRDGALEGGLGFDKDRESHK